MLDTDIICDAPTHARLPSPDITFGTYDGEPVAYFTVTGSSERAIFSKAAALRWLDLG